MKKIIILISLLFSAFLCFAFSKPSKTQKKLDEVTGLIKVYGNDPFTFLGIETKDGRLYSIKADKNLNDELQKTQGTLIEIKGTIENDEKNTLNRLKDGFFIVSEWKVIK